MKLIETENQLGDKKKHVSRAAAVEHAAIVNIQLSEGEEVAEHDADREVFIVARSGKVRFTVEGEPVVVTPENILHMAPKEKHSLLALEDSDIIVIQVQP